jgi:hypothetical protein
MLRLSSAMQTILGRLDAAASRLIDGADAGRDTVESLLERLDALSAAIAGPDDAEGPGDALPEAVSTALDGAVARVAEMLEARDAETRAVGDAARRIGEACAELHGLHRRYLEAAAAPVRAAPGVSGAEPADALADQLDRFERDRCADEEIDDDLAAPRASP